METIHRMFDCLRPRAEEEADRAAAEARRNEVIEKLAGAIARRRLQAPAALFLELNRPLGFLAGQAVVFARPFLAFFLSPAEVEAAAEVLADRQSFERLLSRLQEAGEPASP